MAAFSQAACVIQRWACFTTELSPEGMGPVGVELKPRDVDALLLQAASISRVKTQGDRTSFAGLFDAGKLLDLLASCF